MQNNTFSQLFVGQNLITLATVDSTNSWLKNLLSNSAPLPEGTVILAEKQSAGRGQLNNSWISDAGKNLTFSILLKPSFLPPQKQFHLNKAISLAINDFLSPYFNVHAKIKWPNDHYINNEKIAGILIENIIQGQEIKYAVIGVGLNVNQLFFPPAAGQATSFAKILHKDYDLPTLLREICAAVEARYMQLRSGKIDVLHADYISRLYRYKTLSRFSVDGQVLEGTIQGVTEEGFLQVDLGAGIRQFGLKEIQFIINES